MNKPPGSDRSWDYADNTDDILSYPGGCFRVGNLHDSSPPACRRVRRDRRLPESRNTRNDLDISRRVRPPDINWSRDFDVGCDEHGPRVG